jgi:predicted RNA-binding Zn-ribbon protein involved in translation (DUF1610 family)
MRHLYRLVKRVALGVAVVIAVVALVLLLPLILPGVALAEALEERRLSRVRCSACGNPIGRAEIGRAKQAASRPARVAGETLTRVVRRFLVQWQVICPTCGQRYVYRPNERRAELIPEHRE